jgi:hypothetical protein
LFSDARIALYCSVLKCGAPRRPRDATIPCSITANDTRRTLSATCLDGRRQ